MKHGSLFSGIGGFDLAAEWMGWENVFHCEINPFGQKLLKQYWPNSITYADITKTDFTIHRGNIDILTGGFPCQPYSMAGKRKGKEDDRHLWPEMLRAIREIQPTFIVGENVFGLVNWNGGMVFNEVQTDLETEGYEVTPFILPACAIGAPHRRERVWFVAYSNKCATRPSGKSNGIDGERSNHNDEQKERGEQTEQRFRYGNVFRIDTDTNNTGLQRSEKQRGIKEIGENGNKQPTRFFQPTWQKFPTQSPLCRGDDGIPNRVDRIKGLGNAIVPQVALEIFKAINKTLEV
jgi:DNA (cytosine-5)-methyltransferase 1